MPRRRARGAARGFVALGALLGLCAAPSLARREGPRRDEPIGESGGRPLDVIEAERRLTLDEADDLERRLQALSGAQDRRKGRLRVRLRSLYKLTQGGFGRLVLGADSPRELYVRRNGARQIISRDLEELQALRDELRELGEEQAELRERLGRVAQLEAEAAQARAQAQQAERRQIAGLGALRGALPRPVSPGAIVAPFGRDPVDRGLEAFRHGAELSAEPGAPVKAVAPGQVRYAGEMSGLGRGVVVAHAGGYLTLYGRIDRTQVQVGDAVQAGTTLGRAVYPRVFFELSLSDIPLDPEPWLASRGARAE